MDSFRTLKPTKFVDAETYINIVYCAQSSVSTSLFLVSSGIGNSLSNCALPNVVAGVNTHLLKSLYIGSNPLFYISFSLISLLGWFGGKDIG